MKKNYLLLSFIVSLTTIGNAQIYVDIDANAGTNSGTSWTNAYTDLQNALDAASVNDQIWVAAGTYLPTKDHTGNSSVNNRNKNFHLATDMKIYGGFAGTETQLSQRDAATNITILSGDFNNDDGITGSGNTLSITNNTENAYHVMITADLTATAVIDGFTVEGGNANLNFSVTYQSKTFTHRLGGGIYNYSSSPTITNTTFLYNTADGYGSGMYNYYSSPIIKNTTFSYNTAVFYGGGMYNRSSSPTITNTTFSYNTAGSSGGGMYNDSSSPTITNTTFSYNTASNYYDGSNSIGGGGMHNRSSSPIITNTTFLYNTADSGGGVYNYSSSPIIKNTTFSYNITDDGGGMYNYYLSSPTITNTTFSYNTASSSGGGMYNDLSSPTITNTTFSYNTVNDYGGGMYSSSSDPIIKNTIFWENLKSNSNSLSGADIENSSSSSPTVSYCLTQENSLYSTGTGIINNQNPLFVDAVNGDFGLQNCSPAINAGTTVSHVTDILGNPHVRTVDMGAYEYQGPNIYVNATATGINDGSSWTNAYTDLQDAIDNQCGGLEIWVAAGTYLPTDAPDGTTSTGATDRNNAFHLGTDMKIYGGFAGTETLLSQRDAATNITILSGDFSDDDGVTGSGSTLSITGNTENAYHVMITANLTVAAVIDGFTIKGGNANESGSISYQLKIYNNGDGGGMLNHASSPTLTNTTFLYNTASVNGGGIYNRTSSSPIITNTTFSYNTADSGGGMLNAFSSSPILTNTTFLYNVANSSGGGMYNGSSSPTITNTTLSYNTAKYGGGMYNARSSPILTNTTFLYNTADDYGGGMVNSSSSSPTIMSTTFLYNTASVNGGGMYNTSSSSPIITSTTFSYNTADKGGGMYNTYSSSPTITNTTFSYNTAGEGGGMYNSSSSPTLTNTTFSYNTADYGGGMYNTSSSPTITNTTFSYNTADYGGGMYNTSSSSPTITNTIFWENLKSNSNSLSGADIENSSSSSPTVSYCLTQANSVYDGANNGTGIINNQDPLFVDALNGDFSLLCTSPAINAGTTVAYTTDILGNPHVGTVDMGAYEYQGTPYNYTTAIYVDESATGNNDGLSWTDAYTNLQDAIDNQCGGLEIWVAAGTYYPTKDHTGNSSAFNRYKNFHLATDMKIYGGFAGTETQLSARDAVTNITILSGDFNNDDVVTGSGSTLSITNHGGNVYHVLITANLTAAAVIDGFTIKGGFASHPSTLSYQGKTYYNNDGGGMYNKNSSPTIENLIVINNKCLSRGAGICNDAASPTIINSTISNNYASYLGGGIFNENASSITIINSIISNNYANSSGGGMENTNASATISNSTISNNYAAHSGGGMSNDAASLIINNSFFTDNSCYYFGGGIHSESASTLVIDSTTFDNNTAKDGAGIFNNNSTSTITNSVFSNNASRWQAGGLFMFSSSLSLTNTIFKNNSAVASGGGIYSETSSSTITNSTFANNSAGYDGGGMYNVSSSPTITNTIFWENLKNGSNNVSGADIENSSSSPTVSYCLTQENSVYDGANNEPGIINNQNPLFVDAANGDFSLKGCSPATNAGTAAGITHTTDILGNLHVGIVDMGAYEYQGTKVEITVSAPTVTQPTTCTVSTGEIIVNATTTTGTLEYSNDNGTNYQSSNTFSGLAGGNYIISVREQSSSCTETYGSNPVVINTPVIITVSAPGVAQPTCTVSTGEIIVNATTTTGTLEYSIDNGTTYQGINTFSGLTAGNYNISVREQGSSCTETYGNNPVVVNTSVTIAVSAPTVAQPTCTVSTGEIIVNATTTTGTLEYSNDNGTNYQSSNTFSGLAAGNYNISVREQSSSCTETYGSNPVIINTPVIITVSASTVAQPTCTVSTGEIIVNATTTTGTLEYSNDNGTNYQSSNTFSGLAAGNYNISVKEQGSSCTETYGNNPVVVNTSVTIAVSAPTVAQPTCTVSTGEIIVNATTTTGTLEYSIDNGTTYQGINTFSGLTAGNYNISVREQGSSCTETYGNNPVVVNTSVTIAVSAPTVAQPTCTVSTGEIIVNATTTTGTLEYSNDNGTNYQSSNTFSGLAAGNYNISVREQGSSCTETYGNNPVAINTYVTIAVSAPTVAQPTCTVSTGEIIVNATTTTGTLEYSIDNGTSYQSSNAFSGLTAGNYNISVKEQGSSCTETYSSNPVVINTFIITVSAPTVTQPTCTVSTGTIVVNATTTTGTLEYSNNNGANYQSSNTFSGLTAGNYTISIREQGSSCTETYGSNPVVINAFIITVSAPTVTQPTCTVSTGEIIVNATTTTGTLEYSIDNGTSYQSSNTFRGLTAGNYNISIREQGSSCTETYGSNPVVINTASYSTALYVAVNATGNNDGSSWADAYTNLQDAIDNQCGGLDIWVAAGTYLPTKDHTGNSTPTDNRDKNFHLATDMKIYGGFAGTETKLSQRDAVTHITILSGDFSGDDGVTGSGSTFGITGNTENAFHVMITANLTVTSVIDGFTIKGGNANGYESISYQSATYYHGNGGGMYNRSSAPTIANTTFLHNTAINGGGGMYNYSSSPIIKNTTFLYNVANSYGGGMFNESSSAPIITNTTFLYNVANSYGGGMYNESSSAPIITNTTFLYNTAVYYGGGMYNDQSSPTIRNTTFLYNMADYGGGGMYNYDASSPIIKNTVFWENLKNGSNNVSGADIENSSSSPTITYCLTQENSTYSGGTGIINNQNPLFVDAANGDFSLQGCSPAINAGTTVSHTTDILGNSHVGIVDIGTYEYQGTKVVITVSALTVIQPTCTISTGEIVINVTTTGTETLEYSIDNGANYQSSNTFNGLADGNYAISVREQGDVCTETYGNHVVINTLEITVFVPTVTQPCTVSTGEIIVNASTTTGTLEYSIDYGTTYQASNIFSGLTAESYTISVREQGSSCTETYGSNPVVINALINYTQVYVKIGATAGNNDGSSWANAFINLQDAIDVNCNSVDIWVAAGTYLPTNAPDGTSSTGATDRNNAFHLATDMKIYGGFVGTETQLSQRDAVTHITILSGDFSGDDGVTGSGSTFGITGNTENAFHVMITANLTVTSVIDGFTIKGGNANGYESISYQSATYYHGNGGGMYNDQSSPTIRNTTFLYNTSGNDGGGIYNNNSSNPIITNTTFLYNTAVYGSGGGMYNQASDPIITNTTFLYSKAAIGGGMSNKSSDPIIMNTTFLYNIAVYYGGGMFNESSSPTITNTTFSYNTAGNDGGGMYNRNSSSPTITNTIFLYNTAVYYGGGMYNDQSSPTIRNTTFSYNTAGNYGGGMFNNSYYSSSSPIITNTVFWGNLKNGSNSLSGADIENNNSSSPTVTYCLTQENSVYDGANNGVNNIGTGIINNQDPLFVDAANGDYSLQNCSPAINAGTTVSHITDILGNPHIGIVDMGAYEFKELDPITITANITNGTNPNYSGVPSITSEGAILNTNNAVFKAQNYIELKPGFLVAPAPEQATVFRAEIGGCE
jgi:predicted outer membrane repeat protein